MPSIILGFQVASSVFGGQHGNGTFTGDRLRLHLRVGGSLKCKFVTIICTCTVCVLVVSPD